MVGQQKILNSWKLILILWQVQIMEKLIITSKDYLNLFNSQISTLFHRVICQITKNKFLAVKRQTTKRISRMFNLKILWWFLWLLMITLKDLDNNNNFSLIILQEIHSKCFSLVKLCLKNKIWAVRLQLTIIIVHLLQ